MTGRRLHGSWPETGFSKLNPGPIAVVKSLIATDLAEHEGIALNPVYTGKAMAGLPALNEQKYFEPGTNIVFVHTGGTPALFPYRDGILRRLDLKGKGELKNVLDPPL